MPSVVRSRSRVVFVAVAAWLFLAIDPLGAQDLSGRWCGTWRDCKSGHRGPLRASFSKCDERHYHVVFTGRFFKVIPFRFSTVLDVTGHEDGQALLSGQSRLGLFGTFTYSALATDTDFTADYSSRRYQGQFLLQR